MAGASTATYAAILDKNGDYRFGVGDLEIHDQLSVEWVREKSVKTTFSVFNRTTEKIALKISRFFSKGEKT